jgi:hypothetical protein
MPLPLFLRRIVAHIVLVYNMKYDQLLKKAAHMAEEEYKNNRVEV